MWCITFYKTTRDPISHLLFCPVPSCISNIVRTRVYNDTDTGGGGGSDENTDAVAGSACPAPDDPDFTHRIHCPDSHLYMETCEFECDPGYKMAAGAVNKILCIVGSVNGVMRLGWDKQPSACSGTTCPLAAITRALLK